MCLDVIVKEKGEREPQGDVYGGNVTSTATMTRLTVMPLCRGTRMTHMMRDNGKRERSGERQVFN